MINAEISRAAAAIAQSLTLEEKLSLAFAVDEAKTISDVKEPWQARIADLLNKKNAYENKPTRSISLRLAAAMVARANPNREPNGQFGFGSSNNGTGGNNLNHQEVIRLQGGQMDTQVRKVYEAEEKYQPQATGNKEAPVSPGALTAENADNYEQLWKDYRKEHAAWAKDTTKSIQSDLGAKHLNGTTKGSQAYVDEVTKSDWFVKEFGDGGALGTPKVALKASNKYAGRYYVNTKDGGTTGLDVNKAYSLNEPVFIHEISHYATAISNKTPYAGHGSSFTKNHIYIASKIVGDDYAAGLEKAYKEGGVKIG
jgi:hypothetical protein